jgi:CBS domain containing-hemolysin-like protein
MRPFVAVVRFTFKVPAASLTRRSSRNGGRQVTGGDAEGVEELLMLAEMEDASAALQDEEREMIRGVMELEFTAAREVMVPRPDIVAVEVNTPFDEVASALVERGFSRLPVYEGDIDHIVGIVHVKEVLRHLRRNGRPASATSFAKHIVLNRRCEPSQRGETNIDRDRSRRYVVGQRGWS